MASPRRTGDRLVSTNGCFDLLHRGHVAYLHAARALDDALVVALNSDASVGKLKGPGRPIVPQKIAPPCRALRSVDAVVIFDEDTPACLMREPKPGVHVKGGDYRVADLPEAEVAKEIAGAAQSASVSKSASRSAWRSTERPPASRRCKKS